jgi:hypothetical protein
MGTEYHYVLAAAAPVPALRDEQGTMLVDVLDDGTLDPEAMRRVRDWGDLEVFEGSEHGHDRGNTLWVGKVLWCSEFSNPSAPQMSPGFSLAQIDAALADVRAALARYGDVPVRLVVLEHGV